MTPTLFNDTRRYLHIAVLVCQGFPSRRITKYIIYVTVEKNYNDIMFIIMI